MPNQSRSFPIQVRMNDEELHRLDAQIRAKGMTRSAYLRLAAMERIARDEREATADIAAAPSHSPPR